MCLGPQWSACRSCLQNLLCRQLISQGVLWQVLDEAAKHKLRLVIALANNWDQDSNSDNK